MSGVRAALIREIGRAPRTALREAAVGNGDVSVRVEAVALNPLDITIASGAFSGGHPELPYVPGVEAAGRTEDGSLVYLFGEWRGIRKPGFMCEQVRVTSGLPIAVPAGVDAALAAAIGVAGVAAWVSLAWKAAVGPGDRVLVLGANGAVGSIAVQTAKILGVDLVVASGRDLAGMQRLSGLGADELVELGETDSLVDAFGGEGFTVCIDPLWGEPLAKALDAAAPGARVINVGHSAGPVVPLPSGPFRSKELVLQGHGSLSLSPSQLALAYRELIDCVLAGQLFVDVERLPLEAVDVAWDRQRQGASSKVVVEL